MNKIFATIGSGFFKGKRLGLPSLGTTRSTKNILKGSFFDIFRFDLQGAIFIECFGGSGSMAAEALSNGAKFAIAIEKDRDAFKILHENFDCLNADLQKKFNQQNAPELRAINGDTFEIFSSFDILFPVFFRIKEYSSSAQIRSFCVKGIVKYGEFLLIKNSGFSKYFLTSPIKKSAFFRSQMCSLR